MPGRREARHSSVSYRVVKVAAPRFGRLPELFDFSPVVDVNVPEA
jgi:hypothetical protein